MYMRNRRNYNLNGFPPNYSGQFTPELIVNDDPVLEVHAPEPEKPRPAPPPEKHEKHDEKKSLLGSLFGGKDGKDKDGGFLAGLFGKDKGGNFLAGIELEDLILLAVIFFLLKDGFEDDLIIILALILLAG